MSTTTTPAPLRTSRQIVTAPTPEEVAANRKFAEDICAKIGVSNIGELYDAHGRSKLAAEFHAKGAFADLDDGRGFFETLSKAAFGGPASKAMLGELTEVLADIQAFEERTTKRGRLKRFRAENAALEKALALAETELANETALLAQCEENIATMPIYYRLNFAGKTDETTIKNRNISVTNYAGDIAQASLSRGAIPGLQKDVAAARAALAAYLQTDKST